MTNNRFTNQRVVSRFLPWLIQIALAALVGCLCLVVEPWLQISLVMLLLVSGWFLLFQTRRRRIPVLNYHSVSDHGDWLQVGEGLTVPVKEFELQLRWLVEKGFQSIFVSEAGELVAGDRPLQGDRLVSLTFDDGYLDNWTAVYPLLKKYGIKATLFVTRDFIVRSDRCRPHLGTHAAEDCQWAGYVNTAELQAMQASGVIEIQAHGCTHNRLASNGETQQVDAIDVWTFWEQFPAKKPSWWTAMQTVHPVGPIPRRRHPALSAPAWLADNKRMETEEEFQERVRDELVGIREFLHEVVQVVPTVFCWPENAAPADGQKCLEQEGYAFGVANRVDSLNKAGSGFRELSRVSVRSIEGSSRLSFLLFCLQIRVWEGASFWSPLLWVLNQMSRRYGTKPTGHVAYA